MIPTCDDGLRSDHFRPRRRGVYQHAPAASHGQLSLLLVQGGDGEAWFAVGPLHLEAGVVQGLPDGLCDGKRVHAVRSADRDRNGC